MACRWSSGRATIDRTSRDGGNFGFDRGNFGFDRGDVSITGTDRWRKVRPGRYRR